jgi:signal transduction histidine kinase
LTTTSVLSTNQSNKNIRISVKDTGYGISKLNQSELFGQYVQFNGNSLQQGKGSGLGLWISKSNLFEYSWFLIYFFFAV